METVSRLKCPSFDLCWLTVPTHGGNKEDRYVVIPGGGGSTRSGVKNEIVSYTQKIRRHQI